MKNDRDVSPRLRGACKKTARSIEWRYTLTQTQTKKDLVDVMVRTNVLEIIFTKELMC